MKPLLPYSLIFTGLLFIGLASCKKDNPATPTSNQSQYGPGLRNGPNVLTTFNGNLIAGCYDTIYQWNGSNWSVMGSGFGGYTVSALQVYNGSLYAATGYNVKMWTGSSWQNVGAGFNSYVNALAVYNNNLYAGGGFFTNGSSPDTCIAEWNGSSWTALGAGVYGGVNALAVYNGNLIAAGSISRTGNTSVNNIAQWNGSTWSALGSVTGFAINALTVYNGNLIAGGFFTEIIGPGDTATCIAQWNGSAWASVGTSKFYGGMYRFYAPPQILNFTIYNNNLVIVGFFGMDNGASDLGIWNGTAWSTIAGLTYTRPTNDYNSPTPIFFTCCTIYNGYLVIGGGFNGAGSLSVSSIAAWNGSAWSAL
jgi:hypothetical protein